jgi:hypothetical protein
MKLLHSLDSKRKQVTEERKDYYRVVYRKRQSKKHKTWDDDGFMTTKDGQATLLDCAGKQVACGKSKVLMMGEFTIGNYDLEVVETITCEDLKFNTGNDALNEVIKLKPLVFHGKRLPKREQVLNTKERHDPNASMIICIIER